MHYLSAAHAAASSASDPDATAVGAAVVAGLIAVIWRLARRPANVTRIVLPPRLAGPPAGRGSWKMKLVVAAGVVLGFGYLWDRAHPAGAVKAAARPAPAPTPTPAVPPAKIITRTVTVHAGGHSWPVNGIELVIIVALICVAGFLVVREAGKRFGS
jgi:hypothetical protein